MDHHTASLIVNDRLASLRRDGAEARLARSSRTSVRGSRRADTGRSFGPLERVRLILRGAAPVAR